MWERSSMCKHRVKVSGVWNFEGKMVKKSLPLPNLSSSSPSRHVILSPLPLIIFRHPSLIIFIFLWELVSPLSKFISPLLLYISSSRVWKILSLSFSPEISTLENMSNQWTWSQCRNNLGTFFTLMNSSLPDLLLSSIFSCSLLHPLLSYSFLLSEKSHNFFHRCPRCSVKRECNNLWKKKAVTRKETRIYLNTTHSILFSLSLLTGHVCAALEFFEPFSRKNREKVKERGGLGLSPAACLQAQMLDPYSHSTLIFNQRSYSFILSAFLPSLLSSSSLGLTWEEKKGERLWDVWRRTENNRVALVFQSMSYTEIFVVGFLLLLFSSRGTIFFCLSFHLFGIFLFPLLSVFLFYFWKKKETQHECHLLVEPFFSLNYTSLSFLFCSLFVRLSITPSERERERGER